MDGFDVYKLRTKMGLSRARFGAFIGLEYQTIKKWEESAFDLKLKRYYELALKFLMLEHPLAEYWLLGLDGQLRVVEKWETESPLVEVVHFDIKRNIHLMRALDPQTFVAQRLPKAASDHLGPLEPGEAPIDPFKV